MKIKKSKKHIERQIISKIEINSIQEIIWEEITNVKIQRYSDPKTFRLLGIPRPLKADLLKKGEGGQRIAYFDNGKRFIQKITTWNPYSEYSFDFNPENGFVVAYFFDLSKGVFRVPKGSYKLTAESNKIVLQLSTIYSLDFRVFPFLNLPVKIILNAFQNFILTSIKKNSEYNGENKVFGKDNYQM